MRRRSNQNSCLEGPAKYIVSTTLLLASQGAALAYESPPHIFSINDVLGGFSGNTFGSPDGTSVDPTIICGLGEPCPVDNQPFLDKSGVMLYPVDSEFGFYVVDFLGAQSKSRDGDYKEGFVGNITEGDTVIGIQVSSAPTLKYKVKPPLGTWCQGIGGASVKCETEHYSTMEHVLSCHETIPYGFADPVTGEQKVLSTPDGSLTASCADAPLDDVAMILVDGLPTTRLTNSTPCEDTLGEDGCQMFPNDKTDSKNNLALSTDYSIQLKDDGKPLYGWGGMHKRPNDVRMYAKLKLPDAWKEADADYVVTKAHLVVNHWVTNNPNDQLRPEDLENEAATGRKPSYRIEGTPGTDNEVWKSTIGCYEGDGDQIDSAEGVVGSRFISADTYLKNTPFAISKTAIAGDLPESAPYAFSSDLVGGFTNAFYTTINRDPFEWSYDVNPDPLVQDFVGSALPDDTLGEPVSGPRWRLKSNKFGQDLPGLEIPLIECSPPPFKSDNIKYEVGTAVTTVINLLDWSDDSSPLRTSKGWVDVTANEFVTIVDNIDGKPVTSNGLPMSNDFDLSVYIKGDSKSTAVYNAHLEIEYEGEVVEPPAVLDLAMSISAPTAMIAGQDGQVTATVTNLGPGDLIGEATVEVVGLTNKGETYGPFFASYSALLSGEAVGPTIDFTAPSDRSTKMRWTATVTSSSDTNPINNTAIAVTTISKD